MALILYADDEKRYRDMVTLFLEGDGHRVIPADNGLEAVETLKSRPDVDLVILDVMMPLLDGWGALAEIRGFSTVKVLMLTALGDTDSEVRGLREGADDYIQKPFKGRVFIARVQAALRGSGSRKGSVVSAGGVLVDRSSRQASREATGEAIELAPREFDLLAHLAENRGLVLSRERLIDAVWGADFEGDWRTVDTHIKNLRAKLGAGGELIETRRGAGYVLKDGKP